MHKYMRNILLQNASTHVHKYVRKYASAQIHEEVCESASTWAIAQLRKYSSVEVLAQVCKYLASPSAQVLEQILVHVRKCTSMYVRKC